MATLFIPVGIPGCGKSTFAESLDTTIPVSTDAIREALGDVNDQSKNNEVFAIFHNMIGIFLKDGISVYADATNLDSESRGRLRGIAQEAGAKTHVLLFRNLEQAIRRNAERDRVVPADVMMRMIEKYERSVNALDHHGATLFDHITEVGSVR